MAQNSEKKIYKDDSTLYAPDGNTRPYYHDDLLATRRAGVLMHITSLPGDYYSGDFGNQAFRFIRFLRDSGHSVWQVLPFTPTSPQTGWSPYSSTSAFAGNILFISPEQLAEINLFATKNLKTIKSRASIKSDFSQALMLRLKLTNRAFKHFSKDQQSEEYLKFKHFCEQEQYWLHDYALFVRLKQHFDNRPWHQWPPKYRDRQPTALKSFSDDHQEDILLEKFRQYLFSDQWAALKNYANQLGIYVIGDIPIYCSYDSADVWAHPQLFKLNKDKTMSVSAGVPPDYFSKTGQLWNMPVYLWENHKKEDFEWWLHRIRKNLQWFDHLRLDHFRGFVSGWEVPAMETNAINGQWVDGPGEDFFNRLIALFPHMPFIVEDLGDVDDKVYKLRDQFNLPGMEVLQFAFGEDMPGSVHIPHNHKSINIVYTGTHDNNTLRGWYNKDIDKPTKKRIRRYVGRKIKNKKCHQLFTRMAWASPSRLAIIPVQDILGEGSRSRINHPSTKQNNWLWRLQSMKKLNSIKNELKKNLETYGRC